MEQIAITVDNFYFICRTCLCDIKETDSFDMHECVIDNSTIRNVLMQCALIQIDSEYNLPRRLCQQCHMDLIYCHEFLNKCKKSQETLCDILNRTEVQITIKTEEIDVPIKVETIEEDSSNVAYVTTQHADGYTEHAKSVKRPKAKVECEQCHKRFLKRTDLARHYRVHTKEKPFECDICLLKFTTKGNMETHKVLHTAEKPYICDICSKGYAQKQSLITHKRVHTGERPYVCDVCSKGFSSKHMLVAHKRIHVRVKPYVCDICLKRLSAKHILIAHKRIHTGEKPFTCENCKISFTHKNGLYQHIRNHHSNTSSDFTKTR